MMKGNIVEDLVGRQLALGRGAEIGYVDPAGAVSYVELYRAVRWYAARLAEAGIRPGASGLVVADDGVPAVVAILALWWTGAVAVPVSPMLTREEIEFIARDCRAAYLHVDERADAVVPASGPTAVPRGTAGWALPGDNRVPPPASPDPSDVVLVQYTSGSTGTPKGVRHTRAGIDGILDGFGRTLALGPADTVLSTAKLSFGYGLGNSLIFPLAAGARVVLNPGPPDVYTLGAAAARHRATVLCSVPRMYAALVDRARQGAAPDLGSLRLAVSAGEHLPAPLCAEFTDTFGTPLVNGLGATEVLHIVVATSGSRPGSTGTAVPGTTVSIRDDDGRVLPDGSPGRLHVAGASVAAGYLDRPEASAATFADGGAYTGDIASRDPDGEIRYVCRRDDLINVGGHKVSPFEIENVVRDLTGVAQCAVAGSRDRNGLEQAVAYVVPAPGADRDTLRRTVGRAFRAGLPAFKRPASVEVVDQLPVTSTGKLARYKLRSGGPVAAATVTMRLLRDGTGRTLVCIPYAGGSPGAFTRLARSLPGTWRVVAGEASYPDGVGLAAAARAWWAAIRPYLSDRTVLLGHSLGAVLAAQVATAAGAELDGVQVVLSAPPLVPDWTGRDLVSDDDEVLMSALARSGLLPATSLTGEEVKRLLLPRFRRDIALAPDGFAVDVTSPVHVLLGTDDRLCTPDALAARLPGDLVSSVHLVTGDHYFVTTNPAQTATVLAGLFDGAPTG